jgi:hypothetical protein
MGAIMFDWLRRKPPAPAPRLPEWTLGMHYPARCRWLSHVIDFLGDPTNEWKPSPGRELPQRPEFLVLEFAPREGRSYYTYLSAGLSLYPQTPSGPMPHVELVAYAAAPDPRVAQFVFMLAHDVASAGADEAAFKAFDLWGAECCGLRDFVLVPAREDAALLDFPNRSLRPADERYLLAATGDLQGQMVLNVLQLVPLSAAQWQVASAQGSVALLQQIDWEAQPKTFGWDALRPEE